jgi:homocysteine S-methyltransferase
VDQEVRRFEYKVEAGAEFAITQPVFDPEELSAFLRRIERVRIPIIAGIMPFDSVRHAEYMANEVPGIRVPPAILDRLRRAEASGNTAAEGLAIASEIAAAVRPCVQGIQISTSTGAIETALAVIQTIGT